MREAERGHVERIVGDLHGFAAGQRQAPDLLGAGARGKEIDAGAVDLPSADACRWPNAASGAAASALAFVEVQQPQVGAAAIGFEIGLALHVHHVAAVRRHLRIADARQQVEVGGSEGARRGRRRLPPDTDSTRNAVAMRSQDFMTISGS